MHKDFEPKTFTTVKLLKHSVYMLLFLCLLLTPFSLLNAAGAPVTETAIEENCTEEIVPLSIEEIFSLRVAEQIDSFFRKRVKNDRFNGCVMVAKDGKPIYSGAFQKPQMLGRKALKQRDF